MAYMLAHTMSVIDNAKITMINITRVCVQKVVINIGQPLIRTSIKFRINIKQLFPEAVGSFQRSHTH